MSLPRRLLIAATAAVWLSLIVLTLVEVRAAGWVATSWGAVVPSAAAALTVIAALWARTRHPDDAWEDGHASGVAESSAALAATQPQRRGYLGWRPTFVASLALVALMAGASVLNPGARHATATPLPPATTPASVTLPVAVAPEAKQAPVAAPPAPEVTAPAVLEVAQPVTPVSSPLPAVEAVPALVEAVAADAPVIPVAAPTVAPLTAAEQTALDASNAAALTAANAKAAADLTAANAAEAARVTAANAADAARATAHPNR